MENMIYIIQRTLKDTREITTWITREIIFLWRFPEWTVEEICVDNITCMNRFSYFPSLIFTAYIFLSERYGLVSHGFWALRQEAIYECTINLLITHKYHEIKYEDLFIMSQPGRLYLKEVNFHSATPNLIMRL